MKNQIVPTMLKRPPILILSTLMLTVAACSPAENKNDPIRVEFVGACDSLSSYRSMKPNDRKSMCECLYDSAIKGLSDQERNGARFYLLNQAGVDTQSMNLVTTSDIDVMQTAAKAVADAVKQCPRN